MSPRGLGLWLLLATLGCHRPSPPAAPAQTRDPDAGAPDAGAADAQHPRPARPPPDWARRKADEALCADCHPDEVEAWRRSSMGRSLALLTPDPAPAGLPVEITHPIDGLRFSAHHLPGEGLRFAVAGREHRTERQASYAIGSGNHTRSYLWQRGDALLVAPLTWYRRPARWDLSPGYAVADHPGLDREVHGDCLACHADPPATRPGRPTRWAGPVPGAIGCARCHGDGRPHAEARLAGADAPLVNPAKLPPNRANGICEGCHLQGSVRLLRAGRSWGDFEPGEALEESVAVFDREHPGESFGIASHGARLRRSACRGPNGAPLTCVSCHQPHPTGPPRDRASPCQGCHGPEHAAAHGAGPCAGPGGADCVACHMRRSEVDDIPHVAITDHYIRRRPGDEPLSPAGDAPLVWLADPQIEPKDPSHQRLLGRAYAEAVRAEGRPADLRRALRLLADGLAARPDDLEAWLARAFVASVAQDLPQARAAAETARRLAPADPRVAETLAQQHLALGDGAAALAALALAHAQHPDVPSLLTLEAQAHALRGDRPRAEAAARAALALRPDWARAWTALAFASLAQGDRAAARAALSQATARQPTETGPWLSLARLALDADDPKEAERAYAAAERFALPADPVTRAQAAAGRARAALGAGAGPEPAAAHLLRALELHPAAPGVQAATGALALAQGRAADARRALEAHLDQDPVDIAAWRDLTSALTAAGELAAAAAARARAQTLIAPSIPPSPARAEDPQPP